MTDSKNQNDSDALNKLNKAQSKLKSSGKDGLTPPSIEGEQDNQDDADLAPPSLEGDFPDQSDDSLSPPDIEETPESGVSFLAEFDQNDAPTDRISSGDTAQSSDIPSNDTTQSADSSQAEKFKQGVSDLQNKAVSALGKLRQQIKQHAENKKSAKDAKIETSDDSTEDEYDNNEANSDESQEKPTKRTTVLNDKNKAIKSIGFGVLIVAFLVYKMNSGDPTSSTQETAPDTTDQASLEETDPLDDGQEYTESTDESGWEESFGASDIPPLEDYSTRKSEDEIEQLNQRIDNLDEQIAIPEDKMSLKEITDKALEKVDEEKSSESSNTPGADTTEQNPGNEISAASNRPDIQDSQSTVGLDDSGSSALPGEGSQPATTSSTPTSNSENLPDKLIERIDGIMTMTNNRLEEIEKKVSAVDSRTQHLSQVVASMKNKKPGDSGQSNLSERPNLTVIAISRSPSCHDCDSYAYVQYNDEEIEVSDGDTLAEFTANIEGNRLVLKNDDKQYSYFPQ